ncbi:ATPase AAA [Orpheovirus IHUMI-LCC2]|uniref:ATPase AAA n=1 Tax=Orpheovirus IHUMI-LCC2 TaxID=2023057 RepID=A0A2I2L301_9VIRU|nr:ATPase AAA [Orpheovirus IHUMI-LCC2]SNW61915.1 ATPase AAA [Orpheovirus IHUMI-LCC2]
MTSVIERFITVLDNYSGWTDISLKKGINWDLVKKTLRDLDNMVGMRTVKTKLIEKLRDYVFDYILGNKKDIQYHHIMLCGPPGVGKTEIVKRLAKVFVAFRILDSGLEDSDDNPDIGTVQPKGLTYRELIALKDELNKEYGKKKTESNIDSTYYDDDRKRNNMNHRDRYKEESDSKKRIRRDEDDSDEEKRINKSKKRRLVKIKEISRSRKMMDIIERKVLEKKNEAIKLLLNSKEEELVVVVSRPDFIGKHYGDSEDKTRKLIEKNLGKIIFINEAYSLMSSHQDDYGREVLTMINRYMSDYNGRVAFAFDGYKDHLQKHLFDFQPGLKSRIGWIFEIEKYNVEELFMIFQKQCLSRCLLVPDDVKPLFINKYKEYPIEGEGRGTEKLSTECKSKLNNRNLDKLLEGKDLDLTINEDILEEAFSDLHKNSLSESKSSLPFGFYS